jgi:hypothetical protein
VDPLVHIYYSHSPYNYVVNNPIRLIDPDGKGVLDIVLAVQGFIATHPVVYQEIAECFEVEYGAAVSFGVEAEFMGAKVEIGGEIGTTITASGKDGIQSSVGAKVVAEIGSSSDNGPKLGYEKGVKLQNGKVTVVSMANASVSNVDASSDLKIGGSIKTPVGKVGVKVNLTEVVDATSKGVRYIENQTKTIINGVENSPLIIN